MRPTIKAQRVKLFSGELGIKGDAREVRTGYNVAVLATDGRDGGRVRVGKVLWRGGGIAIARVARKGELGRAFSRWLGPNRAPPLTHHGYTARLRRSW
jgi:hypothetical protein